MTDHLDSIDDLKVPLMCGKCGNEIPPGKTAYFLGLLPKPYCATCWAVIDPPVQR